MRNLTLLALLLLGAPAFAQTAPAPGAPKGSPDDIRSTEIRDIFLRLDANRDGFVSETEWKTGGRTPQGFLMGDANGDRQLSPLEVEVALEKAMEDAVEKPD